MTPKQSRALQRDLGSHYCRIVIDRCDQEIEVWEHWNGLSYVWTFRVQGKPVDCCPTCGEALDRVWLDGLKERTL